MFSKCITFAEIVQGRDASVRVTEDGMIFVVDLVMVVTGKDRNVAGEIIRRTPEEIFQSSKMLERSFPGRGNGKTKLLAFQDAIELIMVLPGKVAKETRTRFAGIIQRYMAGDQSLIAEIQYNAASSAPIAELARGSLDEASGRVLEQGPVVTSLKRKHEELEYYQMETDLQQQRAACMHNVIGVMNEINPGWRNDATLCRQLQDNLLIMTSKGDLNLQLEADRLRGMVEEQANTIKEKDSQLKATKQMLIATVGEKERILNGMLTSKELKKILEVDSFSIMNVLGDRTVKDKCQFSREVMTEFREENHPYFFRNGVVHFYQCNRELVDELVNCQLAREEPMSGPSGPAFSLAEF
jgi:hypothetical protein